MLDIKNLFGKKVKEYRKKLGLTQSQLAEIVNVDGKHISCIESGKNFPSPDLIERIAVGLTIEPKDLFEFYHLQEPENLKAEIITMVNELSNEELVLAYKYIRNFLI